MRAIRAKNLPVVSTLPKGKSTYADLLAEVAADEELPPRIKARYLALLHTLPNI